MHRLIGRGRDLGASTVEFAIVLPVLLLIVFGTIQFGIAYNRMQGLQAAAREGARLASVGASYSEIEERAQASQSLFDTDDVQVLVSSDSSVPSDPPCSKVGALVEVTVEVDPSKEYAITIPLMGEYEIRYSASGKFRCERNGSA